MGDSKLFAYDVSTIFTPGLSAEDSLKLLESYVDQWVKKQLKIEEAERMFEESQEDIDRLVQEYRNSLLDPQGRSVLCGQVYRYALYGRSDPSIL